MNNSWTEIAGKAAVNNEYFQTQHEITMPRFNSDTTATQLTYIPTSPRWHTATVTSGSSSHNGKVHSFLLLPPPIVLSREGVVFVRASRAFASIKYKAHGRQIPGPAPFIPVPAPWLRTEIKGHFYSFFRLSGVVGNDLLEKKNTTWIKRTFS